MDLNHILFLEVETEILEEINSEDFGIIDSVMSLEESNMILEL